MPIFCNCTTVVFTKMSFNVVKSRDAKPNQVFYKIPGLPKSHQLGRKRFHPIVAKFLHFQVNHIPLMINAISAMEGDIRRTEAET